MSNLIPAGAGIGWSAELNILARDVAAEVLETMFYSTAVAGDYNASSEELIRGASLEFHGAHTGTFFAMLTPRVARSLAAACLGLPEDEITVEAEWQLTCELANVLCGAVLSRWDPNSPVHLTAPKPTTGCPQHLGWRERLETPEGPLCVGFSLLGTPWPE